MMCVSLFLCDDSKDKALSFPLPSVAHKSWSGRALIYCENLCSVLLSAGAKPFQWESVHGLLESAIYGGHIDNPFDLRILRSYLEQFFNAQLLSSSSAAQRRSRGQMSHFVPAISLPKSCILLVGVRQLNLRI